VDNEGDGEDILQDAFYELIEACRLMSRLSRLAAGYIAWLEVQPKILLCPRYRSVV